jgi:NADP-dependent 3-hydroxy acid dehydrogenase YdfG
MTDGTAIIIGVGPGLGLALARTFAGANHPVGLIARDAARLDGYVEELQAAGHRARRYQADAGDADALAAAITAAAADLGAPDVLVYNAAVLSRDTPAELSASEFARRLAINVVGAKVAADAVLPLLRDGRDSLLFTGGAFALRPSPESTSMSVGKAALRAYVKALFAAHAGTEVHACTVTIAGIIGGDDPWFAPERIAQTYLEVHTQEPDSWEAELVYAADSDRRTWIRLSGCGG